VQLRLAWIFALLVSGAARAEDVERSDPAGSAGFESALEARVDDVLDRSAELAGARALSLLEARLAAREDAVDRTIAARAEQQLASAVASEVRRVELEGAVVLRVGGAELASGPRWLVGAAEPRARGEAVLLPLAIGPVEMSSPASWEGTALPVR